MYQPEFTITNEILKNVAAIEAAREIIDNAPIVPAYKMKFQKDALTRTVHYGTHLEGNELSYVQAAKVLEGEEIVARERDVQEVINYRVVIDFLDQLATMKKEENKDWNYTQKMVKKIHSLVCHRVIPEQKQGEYRTSQVILRENRSGDVFFRPPPAVEVGFLMEDFITWLNGKRAHQFHPVLRAGISHYVLSAIHPFVEGNGRTARAFATLVLFAEEFDIKRFFSLEEYFDRHPGDYYQALFDVSSQSQDLGERDLTPWLEYFTRVMAIEFSRIKEKVRNLSLDAKLRSQLGTQISLNERQIKLIEYLQEYGQITTAEAKKLVPKFSRDTLLRDLNYFKKKGIVKKKGKTKAARYIFKK
jgi:Fic family protein